MFTALFRSTVRDRASVASQRSSTKPPPPSMSPTLMADSDSAHALYMFCLDPSPPSEGGGGDDIPALEQRPSAVPAESSPAAVAPQVSSSGVVGRPEVSGTFASSVARSLSGEERRSESRTLSSGESVDSGALAAAAPRVSAGGDSSRSGPGAVDFPSAALSSGTLRLPVDSERSSGPLASGAGAQKPVQKRIRANTAVSAGQLSQMSAFSSRRDSLAGGNAPIDFETVLFAFAAARERATPAVGVSRADDLSFGPSSKIGVSVGVPTATQTPPGRRQFLALHLCLFLHENNAEPAMVRWPPSRRYAEWLLRVIPWVVNQPLSRMRWTGLVSSNPLAPAMVSQTKGAASLAAIPPTSTVRTVSAAAAGGAQDISGGDLWQDWLPFHSACAAGALDVAQRLVASDRDALSTPVLQAVLGDAYSQPSLVHPVRIAVEASYWTERYDVVGWLTQMLSPTQLDAQVYAPCKYLSVTKSDFVKLLCKVTPLSLRALRHGSAVGVGGSSTGAKRSGGRSSGAQFLLDAALAAGREVVDARTGNNLSTPGAPGSAASPGNSGNGSAMGSRDDLSAASSGRPGVASGKHGRRGHKGSGRVPARGGSPVSLLSAPRDEEATPEAGGAGAMLPLSSSASALRSAGLASSLAERRVRNAITVDRGYRVVRFRPRSESPMSPRIRDAPGCDASSVQPGALGSRPSEQANVAHEGASAVTVAAPGAAQTGITRSESNGSLQSVSRRARAVSFDAGTSLVSGSRAWVFPKAPTPGAELAELSGVSPSFINVAPVLPSGDGIEEFESVASRKTRKRAAAAAGPRTPIDSHRAGSRGSGESSAPLSARHALSGSTDVPSVSKSAAPAVARRPPLALRPSDSHIAPPVAAPSYAVTLTGLGETILPVQAVASQDFSDVGASHLLLLGLGPQAAIPEASRSKRANDQLGLQLELDAWLSATQSNSALSSTAEVASRSSDFGKSPAAAMQSPPPSAAHSSAQGTLVSSISVPLHTGFASRIPLTGSTTSLLAAGSHFAPSGATMSSAKLSVAAGAVSADLSLDTLSGFDSVGVAMFRGKYGRLGATIKRFENLLHPVRFYVADLVALTDLSGDDVSEGLLYLQRFLGDAENSDYAFVAFEPCESCVTAALEAPPPLPPDTDCEAIGSSRLLGWCKQLVAAVGALHSVGMTHGAILPQNVLLRGQTVRLADAGLTRALVRGAVERLAAHADDASGRGSIVILEHALRHCAHGLAAPEVRSTVELLLNDMLRLTSCRGWIESIEAVAAVIFSPAADAFSLGHVLFEFMSGCAVNRLSESSRKIPPVTLHSGASARTSSTDPAVGDLAFRLSRPVPQERLAVSAALRHPLFLSPQQHVDCIVSFSDGAFRRYSRGIPHWVDDASAKASSLSPELDYLEQAFLLHEEPESIRAGRTVDADSSRYFDWMRRLDTRRGVCWPPASLPTLSSADQNFLSPRQFFEHYSNMKRPCLGK